MIVTNQVRRDQETAVSELTDLCVAIKLALPHTAVFTLTGFTHLTNYQPSETAACGKWLGLWLTVS